jgi:hypothetical protein
VRHSLKEEAFKTLAKKLAKIGVDPDSKGILWFRCEVSVTKGKEEGCDAGSLETTGGHNARI